MNLTTKQVAKILKVSEPRVLNMIYANKFGKLEKFGKNWSIPEAKVNEVKQALEHDSRSNLGGRESQPS